MRNVKLRSVGNRSAPGVLALRVDLVRSGAN